ncbi:MAG: type pilus assembly protein PilB, partial [Phycisphaerales bacterium]|nr:type pilus assembly protein PilB [Phycisphaerales bacterium]
MTRNDLPIPRTQPPAGPAIAPPVGGPKRARIGETLVSEGVLSPEQLQKALAQQKATGRMLGELLVDQGVISGSTLVQVLAKTIG